MKRAFDRPPRVCTRSGVSAAASEAGTVTASWVSDAEVTSPVCSPKRTVLPAASGAKLVPATVTVWPGSALGGVIEVTTGAGGFSLR